MAMRGYPLYSLLYPVILKFKEKSPAKKGKKNTPIYLLEDKKNPRITTYKLIYLCKNSKRPQDNS